MKKTILMLAITAAVTACETTEYAQPTSKRITFTAVTKEQGIASRATETPTRLYVLDYTNSECVSTLTQNNTDTDFGSPTLDLTYGQHEIVFLAPKTTDVSLDTDTKNITYTAPPKPLWAKRLMLTVNKDTEGQQVELTQRAWKLTIDIKDNIPTNVTTMLLSLTNSHKGLTWAQTLATRDFAGYGTDTERSVNIASAQGSNAKISLYGFAPTEAEYNETITITFKTANNETVQQYTKTIPLQSDYTTTLKGNFFAHDNTFTVTFANAFANNKDEVEL